MVAESGSSEHGGGGGYTTMWCPSGEIVIPPNYNPDGDSSMLGYLVKKYRDKTDYYATYYAQLRARFEAEKKERDQQRALRRQQREEEERLCRRTGVPFISDLKRLTQELYWLEEPYLDYTSKLALTPLPPPALPAPTPLSHPMLPPPHEFLRKEAMLDHNMEKYMQLLTATQCFYRGGWKDCDMTRIYEGVHSFPIDYPPVINAAGLALSFLHSNTMSKEDETANVVLKQVIRANVQVLGCAARVMFVTMEASDNNFYEAVVVVSMNMREMELKFIRPAKFYPHIPTYLHHLLPTY